jgi:YhgE/Pip-like protein
MIWLTPLLLGSVVVAIITAFYIGSVVNPQAHLRGLPVAVVNQDAGATVGSRHISFGQQVEAGLLANPQLSTWLHMQVSTLPQAEQAMDRDSEYATLVIPPDFTASLLNVSGLHPASTPATALPRAQILTNQRAGSVGVSLASGIFQQAMATASVQIGKHLTALAPASALTPTTRALLANPVTVTTVQYRPLPANAATGLSAFYVALLTLMCGFIGGTIVNSVVDSALGYATNEMGPRWRQRQPVPINRWQTLLIKWPIAVVLTAVMVAVLIAVAAGGFGMDTPYPGLLWVYGWLCAASVGIGIIALFAVAGNFGQLIGLVVFVYAGLASAGGTVPIEALPTGLRWLSYVEPLRQVLAGTRSILYFNAQGVAGLTRGTVAAASGLVFWLVVGTVIVRWYDSRHLYRIQPDVLAQVNTAVQDYKTRQASPSPASSDAGGPTGHEEDSREPGDGTVTRG